MGKEQVGAVITLGVCTLLSTVAISVASNISQALLALV